MAGMVTHFNDITVRVELDNGWHVPVHRVYSPVQCIGGESNFFVAHFLWSLRWRLAFTMPKE